jgi:hypothetical protein
VLFKTNESDEMMERARISSQANHLMLMQEEKNAGASYNGMSNQN